MPFRGDRMRKARERRGLTLRDLGNMSNLSFGYLSRIERGKQEPSLDALRRIADVLGVTTTYLLDDDEPQPRRTKDMVRIPVVGRTHAGTLMAAEQVVDEYLMVPKAMLPGDHDAQYFALRVQGDCMEPVIPDGATVIVRRQPDVESGQIAVVLWDDTNEAQVRRVYKSGKRIILQPDNRTYPPVILTRGNVRILGRVLKVLVDLETAAAASPAML